MADRSVRVILSAVTTGFSTGMAKAAAETDKLAGKVEASKDSISKVGQAATLAGAAIVGGLGFAAKSAMDWESAWAGVKKTVDGSAGELERLEGQLRSMATSLPASHEEIAAVAEAAGQLGVKTPDVAAFTKVMIDLGNTTNLTADEAATSLAQLMNVMGTAPQNVSRLGATIVDLGNKGASTERQIVQMGQRIAAAGKSVGMSETAVLGFASALASVGVEVEAGGTAISMTFKDIDKAVRQGGAGLELIAKTSGMSADAYRQAWGRDAAGATNSFIEGLGRLKESGGSAIGVLDELGMTGERQSDAVMRLVQSHGLLKENLDNAAAAWQDNTALIVEASKRYETTESKVKVAWNGIKDSAIDAGAAILPVVADMASKVAGLSTTFGKLPEGTQRSVVGLAAVTAGGLLAVGGLAKLVTTGAELHGAFKTLEAASPRLAGAVKGVGKAAAAAAVGMTALQIANAVAGDSWKRGQTRADDLAAAMSKTTGAAYDLNSAFKFEEGAVIKTKFDGIGASLKRALDPSAIDSFGDAMNGLTGAVPMAERIARQFGEVDKSLASLAQNGMGEKAAAQFAQVSDAAKAQGIDIARVIDLFPQYKSQLMATAEALGVAGLSSQDYADWMGGKVPAAIQAAITKSDALDPSLAGVSTALNQVGEQAAASKKELEDLADQMKELADEALKGAKSQIAVEESIAGAADYRKKSLANLKVGLDDTQKAGRENIKVLMDLAESSKNVTGTTEEMAKKQVRAHDEFLKTTDAMKLSRDKAEELWTAYTLIPGQVSTKVDAPGAAEARKRADEFNRALAALPPAKQSEILSMLDAKGFKAAEAYLASIKDKDVTVTTNFKTVGQPGYQKNAAGGHITGPGTGTSDSILSWLSNGEFVIKASSVDKIGLDRLWYMNRFGRLPAFAEGGSVHYSSAPPRSIGSDQFGAVIQQIAMTGPLDLSPASINALASVLLAASNASVSSAARASAFVGRPA